MNSASHPSDWGKVELGDHVDLLTGYPFRSAEFVTSDDAVRLLKGSVVSQAVLDWRNAVGWSLADLDEYEKYQLELGDVVLAMDRPWIEAGLKYAWVAERDLPCLLVQRVARLRGTNGLDTTFLRYVVGSPGFTNYIAPIVTGATVPHISPRQICGFSFPLPPLRTQRKIAAVLSDYDALIENNDRRINILEEMAQRIYREWFVDFQYPGHDGVPLVQSELGPIPSGWTLQPLSLLTETITRGISPRYSDASDQRVINQRCIRDGTLDLSLARGHSSSVPSHKMILSGDVLINSTGVGTLGRVAQVLIEPMGLSADSHVTIVRPTSALVSPAFFGMTLLARESDLSTMGVGSTGQTELGRAAISEIRVVVPPLPLQLAFAEAVEASRRLSMLLRGANKTLRASRDLVLPALISGEIDVTDLDIAIPNLVA